MELPSQRNIHQTFEPVSQGTSDSLVSYPPSGLWKEQPTYTQHRLLVTCILVSPVNTTQIIGDLYIGQSSKHNTDYW